MEDEKTDLNSVTGDIAAAADIPAGPQLLAFAEAVVARSDADIESTRSTLVELIGPAGTADAAAVVANFQRMVRIADSTGIPLDEPVMMLTQGIRDELGINEYHAAANSPALAPLKKIVGRLLGPFVSKVMRRIARSRVGAPDTSQ